MPKIPDQFVETVIPFHDVVKEFPPHHLNWGWTTKAYAHPVDRLYACGVGPAFVDDSILERLLTSIL